MKTKPIVIIVILSLMLVAFITNPDKDRHLQNASQVLMEKAYVDNSGMKGIFLELLSKEVARSKVEISNYYLFSISYVYSEERNKTMSLGLGLYGQVIPILSESDYKEYKSGDKVDTTSIEKTESKELSIENNAGSVGAEKEKDTQGTEAERKTEQKKLDDLIGGIGKSDEIVNSDKGKLDGDSFAPSYFKSFNINSSNVVYGLSGRGQPKYDLQQENCNENGVVIIRIKVNREGKVVEVLSENNEKNNCLVAVAKKTALTFKWPKNNLAPKFQLGFVAINFE